MVSISWLRDHLKPPENMRPSAPDSRNKQSLTPADEESPAPQPSVLLKTGYKHWHKSNLEYAYWRCIQEFEGYGFSPEDIDRLRVEQLSAKEFKTSSDRIQRMIVTAFYVGKMRGIRESDETFAMFTPSLKEDIP